MGRKLGKTTLVLLAPVREVAWASDEDVGREEPYVLLVGTETGVDRMEAEFPQKTKCKSTVCSSSSNPGYSPVRS